MRFMLLALLAAGCEKDLLAELDAGGDAPTPDVAIPAGNWTCVGQPRATTAPDPVAMSGKVQTNDQQPLGDVAVAIHAVSDDALLGQGTTDTASAALGTYSIDVATAGTAPVVYRTFTKAGYVDEYLIDAFPMFISPSYTVVAMTTPQELAGYYAAAGITPDPQRSTIVLSTLDCPDQTGTRLVAGVTVQVAGGGTVAYLDAAGTALDRTATATTASGHAIIFNAPTGPFEVTLVAGPYTYRSWPIVGRAGAIVAAPHAP